MRSVCSLYLLLGLVSLGPACLRGGFSSPPSAASANDREDSGPAEDAGLQPPDLSLDNPSVVNRLSSASFGGSCERLLPINVSGSDQASIACPDGSFSYTVEEQNSDAARAYHFSQTDDAGASAQVTGTWTRDTVAPQPLLIQVNGGAAVATSPLLRVTVQAQDPAGVSQIRIAPAGATCQDAYADGDWRDHDDAGPQDYTFVAEARSGSLRLCLWARDALGNTSVIHANGGMGIDGQEACDLRLDLGQPPQAVAFLVQRAADGARQVSPDDPLRIDWTITDNDGLDAAPVSLFYSTDNLDYSHVVCEGAACGTCSAGSVSWSASHSAFVAPSAGFLRLRMVLRDASGNTSIFHSDGLNMGSWEIYAGSEHRGDGASATGAVLGPTTFSQNGQAVAVASSGDIYIYQANGLRRVDAGTGIIGTVLAAGATAGVPGPLSAASLEIEQHGGNLMLDRDDNIYLNARGGDGETALFKIDSQAGTIAYYVGEAADGSLADALPAAQSQVYDCTSLALDPASKELYFFSACDDTYHPALILRKVSQNADGSAGLVSTVAGDCSHGWPADGTPANSQTPINHAPERGLVYYNSMVFCPANGALYYSIGEYVTHTAQVYKILDGYIYGVSTATVGWDMYVGGSMVYSERDGRVYLSQYDIASFLPTDNAAGDELVELVLPKHSSVADTGCVADGLPLAQACVYTGLLFTYPDGTLGYAEGAGVNGLYYYVLRRISPQGLIETVAGSPVPVMPHVQRQVARFGEVFQIDYKSPSAPEQLLFPAGLYLADSAGRKVAYIDPDIDDSYVIAGNGKVGSPTNGSPFDTTSIVSRGYSGRALGRMAFGPDGRLYYDPTYSAILTVDAEGLQQYLLTGDTPFYAAAADGALANTVHYEFTGQRMGIVFDQHDNLYFGGEGAHDPENLPCIGRVDLNTGTYHRVLRGTTSVSGPDQPAGQAQGADIRCGYYAHVGIGQCSIRYDRLHDRLLLAEVGGKLRAINQPYDVASSSLVTLYDFGESIGAFLHVEADNSVYYVGGDLLLHCHDLDGDDPPGCDGSPLGPPAPLDGLDTLSMTMDDAGRLYLLRDSSVVLRYTP